MSFDPEEFLNAPVGAELDTEFVPIPPGEYEAMVEDLRTQSGEKDGNPWYRLDVTYDIPDPEVAEATQRPKNTARHTIFLDVENGKLDTGPQKNIGLGRFMAACGLDMKKDSPKQAQGCTVKVRIGPRNVGEGTEVKAVTKA